MGGSLGGSPVRRSRHRLASDGGGDGEMWSVWDSLMAVSSSSSGKVRVKGSVKEDTALGPECWVSIGLTGQWREPREQSQPAARCCPLRSCWKDGGVGCSRESLGQMVLGRRGPGCRRGCGWFPLRVIPQIETSVMPLEISALDTSQPGGYKWRIYKHVSETQRVDRREGSRCGF